MKIEIGQTLENRYLISKKLGEGYFGRVYLAHDNLLPRTIAIKELKPQFLEEPQVVQRFVNDARAAVALQHENIVMVYDLLPPANPQFILLEYLPQMMRETLNREGPFNVSRAAKIGMELCDALGLAHQRSIIHRDIKPENILFTDKGTTKLCDFGIAHLPAELGGMTLTYQGGHPGTPVYKSPEQVRGLKLDGRSDLYTVGVVLYEMLTGRHYFDYSGFKSTYEVDEAVLKSRANPPSATNTTVPAALDAIVLKLLEKDPNARFQSATDVIKALEPFANLALVSREYAPRMVLASVTSSARREGPRFRYQIKLEAINEGNRETIWGGLTIQILSLTSKDQLAAYNINAWGNDGVSPLQYAPGDLLWGFLEDGSWGQKPAKYLMLESVVKNLQPGHQMSFDLVLTLDLPRIDVYVRAWASWKNAEGKEKSDGDPPWGNKQNLDHQGFSCFPLTIGFEAKNNAGMPTL